MLDFRKVLLGLAVAGLGLVGTASAQVANCANAAGGGTAVLNAPGALVTLPVEGTTELLSGPTGPASVIITGCTGTVSSATIVLTSNVPFTAASSAAGVLDVTATAQNSIAGVAQPSIAAASIVQSGNTITATFNVGGATLTGFTFTGIRVNASAAPATSLISIASSGVAGGGVTGSITAANYAQVAVSQVTPVLAGAITQTLCTATLAAAPALVTTLTLQENFPGALRTAVGETQAGAGFIAATQGTRIAVTFNNLNAGVNYYVPATLAAPAGANGAGATNALTASAYAAAAGGTAITAVTAGSGGTKIAGQVLLTVTNGSATIYYGVTAADGGAVSVITIPLIETVPSAPAVTTVATSPVTASAYLVGVATGYPQYAAVTTPTTINQAAPPALPATNSVLTACSTTLLFPYIVNSGGFDTGVALTNASTATFSLAGAASTPTAGTCIVTFYGAGAATAPGNAYSTGTIATATDAVFLASVVQPGIQGYAVAVCNFQGAHGYAFITDGFGGGGRGLSANYLAPILAEAGLAVGTVAF
jgi:hypothetical protein